MDNPERYQTQLENIFRLVHGQHKTLRQAIEFTPGISKTTFYEIPIEYRDAVEGPIRTEVENEQNELEEALSRYRAERSVALQAKVLEAMDEAVDVIIDIIRTEKSAFNRIQAFKELRAMAMEGIVVPVADREDMNPALPAGNGPLLPMPFPVQRAKLELLGPNGSTLTIESPKRANVEIIDPGGEASK